MLKKMTFLGAVVAVVAAVVVPAVAQQMTPQEKAVEARRGFMKLVVWEAGPLFGMAKGAMAYDADAAKAHAANLKALSQYPAPDLFLPGSSNTDLAGKTRALQKIWDDSTGFHKAFDDWVAAVDALQGEVGKGQPELAAAVGKLGGSCGGCHKPYRAENF